MGGGGGGGHMGDGGENVIEETKTTKYDSWDGDGEQIHQSTTTNFVRFFIFVFG